MKEEEGEVEERRQGSPLEGGQEALERRVKELEEALREERERSERYLNQLKYLQADLDNLRKGMERRMEEIKERANERLLLELLSIKDDLERAIEAAERGFKGMEAEGDHLDERAWRGLLEGVRAILKNVKEVLAQEGVMEIEALGRIFEPRLHEAVAFVEREDVEENTIVGVVRKGYLLKGRVLRTSLVEVAKAKGKGGEEVPSLSKDSAGEAEGPLKGEGKEEAF